jgi:aminopeptidase N
MMQTIVGRKGFRKGMDEYFKRHDGQAVTILDFADAIATPNKADFTQFKLWYSQSGTPEVNVTENYDEVKKQFTLTLKQFCKPSEKQPVKKAFHIPLLVGLLNSKGKDILIRSNDVVFNSDEQPVVHLKQETQSFVFNEVTEKPVLSLNREFSAPIKLNWNASQAEFLHLIKYDSDSFNRREAVYKMTLNELRRLIASHTTGQTLIVNPEIVSALGTVLSDTKIDAQFKALMLQLPNSDILAQEEEVLDALAFASARNALVNSLVEQYEVLIKELYLQHHAVNSIGDRALKNTLLRYLIEAEVEDSVKMAATQYNEAKNMTDTIAALSCLCETNLQDKEMALADFLTKWKDDAVVFNKYLLVQAIIEKENTFEVVVRLSQTAPFSVENPNNIYSLLGAFGENYLATQRKDGKAYKWLCDQILKIDKNNPLVAARVCGSFNYVNKFPEPYRTHAFTEIKRVLAEPKLSNNSRELLETLI